MNHIPFITFALGILTGEIVDFIYDRLNERNIEGDISLLHWLEHYHWGMAFLVLYEFPTTYFPQLFLALNQATSSPFMVGLGVSLILDENRGDMMFAYKKGLKTQRYHFYESTVIGIMIGALLVLRWLYVPISLTLLHFAVAFCIDLVLGTIVLVLKPFKSELPKPVNND